MAPSKPIAIRIELEAPASCADVNRFYARLRARTDRVRSAEGTEEAVRLRVRVTPTAGKIHGELSFMDDTKPRSVDGATCEEVLEALSLTAALALDPSAQLGATTESAAAGADSAGARGLGNGAAGAPGAPAPSAGAATAPPALPEREEPDTGAAYGSLESSSTFAFQFGGQLELASLIAPEPNFGGAVFTRVIRRSPEGTQSSLGLAVSHGSNHVLQSSSTLAVALTSVAISACPLALGRDQAVRFEPCAFASGGVLVASSRGVESPSSVRRSFWAAGALLRAAVPIGSRIAFELAAGFSVPLVQREFKLSPPDQFLGETPSITGFGSVGAAYGF